ncbi:MAG: DUF177 domain-containing protein [Actinobacteria bacterium]|nr:DUF177 domain-containing protein [Actinomycetota bacterium]MBU1492637.1 DUF177 domain-containing protein [Actinomycetota bacterium]
MGHPSSPFRIVVSDLLHRTGERRVEELSAPVDWGVELSRLVPNQPLLVEVSLEGASGGVYASGKAVAVAEHACHRCNATWQETIEVPLGEMIESSRDADYPLDGEVADLENPVRDAVVLALPLLPTCRPDCLGLCGRCGADLNTGACPGHDEDSSSPFAGLRELLEP